MPVTTRLLGANVMASLSSPSLPSSLDALTIPLGFKKYHDANPKEQAALDGWSTTAVGTLRIVLDIVQQKREVDEVCRSRFGTACKANPPRRST